MRLKRAFDLVVTIATMPLWVPVLAVVALVVRFSIGGPVLFRQPRPGRKGKVFRLVKFRSMTEARDLTGALLPDSARLTRIGRCLRASSLDELPELWNVLRGDMSLVGPRPLLVQYLPRYDSRQSRRHEVPPGLTGLAQVMGRNALGWEEKLEWDVRYVERRNFALDLRILWLTVASVLGRRGITAAGDASMPEFRGSIHAPDTKHHG